MIFLRLQQSTELVVFFHDDKKINSTEKLFFKIKLALDRFLNHFRIKCLQFSILRRLNEFLSKNCQN